MKESIENKAIYGPSEHLVAGNPSYHDITEQISSIVERKTPLGWYLSILIPVLLTIVFFSMMMRLFFTGIGIWGNQVPVGWAFDITNFVFWVGIGHAGTLISAILFLLRQRWRRSINRFAEAMTIFAIICAGIWPAIHVGRPWVLYWAMPIPSQMGIWPNFRSPLVWDFFAVGTYFTVSFMFWYMGMVPDLAVLRDRAKTKTRKWVYGLLAVGWRNANRHWRHYQLAYLILAGIATPLVLSVHSIVSTDFATSILPAWHSTIFPPYFVAGAIYSGFAMVLTLAIIIRKAYHLENLITMHTIERMNKIILVTGLMVTYAYTVEFFMAYYSGNIYERYTFLNRVIGPYWWAFAFMALGNIIAPQVFWSKKMRTNLVVAFIVSILANLGMWSERFVIIVGSLSRDFLPSSWHYFKPTIYDIGMLAGSIGLFLTMFLLFLRFLPMIAIQEIKGILPQAEISAHKSASHSMGNKGE